MFMDKNMGDKIFFMMSVLEKMSGSKDCVLVALKKDGLTSDILNELIVCIRKSQSDYEELNSSIINDALDYLEEILCLPGDIKKIELEKVNKMLSFYFL